MLKLCMIIIILISSYLFGHFLSRHIDERQKDLESFISSVNELERQVSLFQSENSAAILKSFNEKDSTELITLIKQRKKYSNLTIDETKKIVEFILDLGHSDVNFEVKKCEDCKRCFTEILGVHNQGKNKLKKLYKTVSISFGLIIAVLVI